MIRTLLIIWLAVVGVGPIIFGFIWYDRGFQSAWDAFGTLVDMAMQPSGRG